MVFLAFEQAKFGISAEALQKLSLQQIACIGHWKKGRWNQVVYHCSGQTKAKCGESKTY